MDIERCGKLNSVNCVSESWTGIGVVTAFVAGAFMVPWPHLKMMDSICGLTFTKTLLEFRSNRKTCNQFDGRVLDLRFKRRFVTQTSDLLG